MVVLTARSLNAEERKKLEGVDKVLKKGETSIRALAGEVGSVVAKHDSMLP